MQRGLLLDVIVGKSAAILQLLPRKNEALLVRRNALLILNLLFHSLNRVARLHVESNGLSSKSFDEDLHCIL